MLPSKVLLVIVPNCLLLVYRKTVHFLLNFSFFSKAKNITNRQKRIENTVVSSGVPIAQFRRLLLQDHVSTGLPFCFNEKWNITLRVEGPEPRHPPQRWALPTSGAHHFQTCFCTLTIPGHTNTVWYYFAYLGNLFKGYVVCALQQLPLIHSHDSFLHLPLLMMYKQH